MSKFKVMIVEKDGIPIAVQAAEINGRVICIALKDEPELMGWHNAIKCGIPSNLEWLAISENIEEVNQVLKEYDSEPLEFLYWSSTECRDSKYAWIACPSANNIYGSLKTLDDCRVRKVLINVDKP